MHFFNGRSTCVEFKYTDQHILMKDLIFLCNKIPFYLPITYMFWKIEFRTRILSIIRGTNIHAIDDVEAYFFFPSIMWQKDKVFNCTIQNIRNTGKWCISLLTFILIVVGGLHMNLLTKGSFPKYYKGSVDVGMKIWRPQILAHDHSVEVNVTAIED